MDGIINVIKPPGMTSHDVISYLRRLLRIPKVGHTGTLDPGASGVLPVCVGKATRISSFLTDYDKTYVCEMTLGIATDSQDASGETEEVKTGFQIEPKELANVLGRFLGSIKQIPPMKSAVRVNGQRLYELERQGKKVARKPRVIVVKDLHINKIWPEEPFLQFGSRVLLEITCSKGTYVRTLCHDIGQELGVGAHMSFLSRTKSGPFVIERGITLEEITREWEKGDYSFIQPIEDAFPQWPKVTINPLTEKRVQNGNFVTPDDFLDVPRPLTVGDQVLIFNLEQELLALGEIRKQDRLLCQPTRVFRGEVN